MNVSIFTHQEKTIRSKSGIASLLCLVSILLWNSGCSSSQDQAASQPAAQVQQAVAQLNESGAEIVLDEAGEVVAVKLPEKTSPEVIATLASLSKLKRVDASETDLQQTAFDTLKSSNPNVKIEFPL
ncbi:hypothetical protein [Gimesia sp.]|uniref:hypothetical protein n=1 Tax=Gimesia sp. TaxID=2024833 RepID=UPI003A8DEB3B